MGPGTTLNPSSPQARAIADLLNETLVVAGVTLALVGDSHERQDRKA
jgi:hypothetical protein